MKSLLVLSMAVVLTTTAAFAGSVTPTNNAMTMVNALVSDQNIQIQSASYTGGASSSGLFSGLAGALPFDSGVLLTTGVAATALGPNDDGGAGTSVGTSGDGQLSTLAANPTFDAAVLTFDFIPTKGTISFQFVFGSEEYQEYVNSQYNDVFAFYLNGVNIALIPSTTTPIAINSVNHLVNTQYYSDNPTNAAALQYDGLVGVKTVLFATGAVNANQLNTIKIAIADAGDSILDSGVFLKGGSFKNEEPPNVPEPGSMAALSLGLLGVGYAIRRRRAV